MPDDWIPNCGTQLERAIRALLIEKGAGSVDDCFISNDSRERGAEPAASLDSGLTTILAQTSTTESQETTGNETWQVVIQVKFGSADETEWLNRLELDRKMGRIKHAMSQVYSITANAKGLDATCDQITEYGRALAELEGDDGTANEDMAEFSCIFGRFLGSTRGKPEDASCAWVEVLRYEFIACPVAIEDIPPQEE